MSVGIEAVTTHVIFESKVQKSESITSFRCHCHVMVQELSNLCDHIGCVGVREDEVIMDTCADQSGIGKG